MEKQTETGGNFLSEQNHNPRLETGVTGLIVESIPYTSLTGKELREISEIIDRNEVLIKEKWDEHFSK